MENTVRIHLSPYNALAIKNFLRSQVKRDQHYIGAMKVISNAVDEYEKEVLQNISASQLEVALDEQGIIDILNQD